MRTYHCFCELLDEGRVSADSILVHALRDLGHVDCNVTVSLLQGGLNVTTEAHHVELDFVLLRFLLGGQLLVKDRKIDFLDH